MNLIDSGPAYAVYQGSDCAVRMDWNRGAVRFTYAGQVAESCSAPVIQKLDAMVRSTPSITVMHDFWDASGLQSAFRSTLVDWSRQRPSALASVDALARSKFVVMAMNVWAMTPPGLKICSTRKEFDVLCAKAGLPTNIHLQTPAG